MGVTTLQAMETQRRDLNERKDTMKFVSLNINIFIKLQMCIDVGSRVPVVVRAWLQRVGSFLPPCGFQGLNSGLQTC